MSYLPYLDNSWLTLFWYHRASGRMSHCCSRITTPTECQLRLPQPPPAVAVQPLRPPARPANASRKRPAASAPPFRASAAARPQDWLAADSGRRRAPLAQPNPAGPVVNHTRPGLPCGCRNSHQRTPRLPPKRAAPALPLRLSACEGGGAFDPRSVTNLRGAVSVENRFTMALTLLEVAPAAPCTTIEEVKTCVTCSPPSTLLSRSHQLS